MHRQPQKLRCLDSVPLIALALLIILWSGMVYYAYRGNNRNGLTNNITGLQQQKILINPEKTTMLPLTQTDVETTQQMGPVTRPGCFGRFVKGILVYSIKGGLVNGRVININGRTTANPHRFCLNLWSRDKRMIVMHFDIRFNKDILFADTMRNANANIFPEIFGGEWDENISVMGFKPITAMDSFQAKIYAVNSTGIVLLLGKKNYVENRLGVALHDITWFTVVALGGNSPSWKELCVW